jgi:tetratricopeptide (TPR) repeat protein
VSRPLSAFSFRLSALYAFSILCGALAFMSKQNTASLPLAILLVEYLCVDSSWESWKKKIPLIGMAIIIFLLTLLYVSGAFRGEISAKGLLEDVSMLGRETDLVSRWSYLCTQFNVLVIYIRLLFIPIGQSLDHLYLFKSGFFDDYTPAAFLFLLGLIVLGVFSRTKRPVLTLGIFWFFITLSVESSIIPIRDAMFEHRLYLPIFGFAFAVAFLLFQILSTRNSFIILVSVLIITALGTVTYLRNGVWQDDLTLWKDVLSKNPKNIRASNNLGRALAQSGRFEEADSHFSDVLRFDQEDAKAHFNKGVAMAGQGRFEEALRYYEEALRINPRYAQAHYNSGTVFETLGELEEALKHYLQALQIKPDYLKPRINAGVIFARKGQMDKAVAYLSEALESDPENAMVHNNLAGVMAGMGRIDDAIHYYNEAIRIMPDYADAHYNLGVMLKQQGDYDSAIRHLSESVHIRPDHANARYDLGSLFAKQGRLDEAVLHLAEAVRLQPDDCIPACYDLACVYARLNSKKNAVAWLQKAVEAGFSRWDLLRNDRDIENIRNTSYYKSLINEQGSENGSQESEEGGRP